MSACTRPVVLAYDFGTGGIKAALFDERGACVRDAFAGYETFFPGEGMREQRPVDWWRAVVASTRARTVFSSTPRWRAEARSTCHRTCGARSSTSTSGTRGATSCAP